jgi:hypothetical protein
VVFVSNVRILVQLAMIIQIVKAVYLDIIFMRHSALSIVQQTHGPIQAIIHVYKIVVWILERLEISFV